MGGFDDLTFEEEIDDCPRPSKPNIRMLSSQSATPKKLQAKETSPERTEEITVETPIKQSAANEVPIGLNQAESTDNYLEHGRMHARGKVHFSARQYGQVDGGNVVDYGTQDSPDPGQIFSNMATGVSNKISFIRRVNLANGWDVGASPQEKSEDLTLGLRDGLCGALSSFSSWISSMVNLFRDGKIGEAFVGLMLGIQLPLVSYRCGQYVSVYIFVWRCRREKRQDERRGYGIQLQTSDEEIQASNFIRSPDSLQGPSVDSADDSHVSITQKMSRTKGLRTVHDEESEVPSIRAIFTALFITCLVAQLTSLTFFKKPEDRLLALSLLFSPLGVLVRWRMMKFNSWRPGFPLGTFACNVTACALSGTLGTLIAGKPGPRERIALVSIIAGFGGTLSSVARFIVEILSLIDPILFRLDGIYYAFASVGTGLLLSFLFAASVDWADSVE
jgi:fluoride ion exporter CrcB/FEX